jgi:hypothetical protein
MFVCNFDVQFFVVLCMYLDVLSPHHIAYAQPHYSHQTQSWRHFRMPAMLFYIPQKNHLNKYLIFLEDLFPYIVSGSCTKRC